MELVNSEHVDRCVFVSVCVSVREREMTFQAKEAAYRNGDKGDTSQ